MGIKQICISVVFWLFQCGVFAQGDAYQFMRLDLRNGLSHNQVNCVFKDSRGFIWFGTMSGLNRYDGYDFRVFKHDLHDTTTLSDNYVERIYELPDRKLWIATRNGNNIYDPVTDKISRDNAGYLSDLSLPPGSVHSVVKDRQGNYWFVYQNNGGLYRYSPGTQKIMPLLHNPADTLSIVNNDVAALAQDTANNIWIVHRNGTIEKLHPQTYKVVQRTQLMKNLTRGELKQYALFIDRDNELWISVLLAGNPGGVFYYRPVSDQLYHFTKEKGELRLNTNIVTGITQDEDGLIWIGTDHGGVNLIDKNNKAVRFLLNDAEDHTTISQNSIYAVYRDSSNHIWLGTYKQGVSYYRNSKAMFRLFRHKVSDPNSLPYEDVNRFAEDAKGNIWIGTNGGGLLYYDRKRNKYTVFRHNPSDPNSLSSNVVVTLYIDHEEKLWIGTYFGGLNCYDGRKFTRFKHDERDTTSISDNSIWEIFEDRDNNLWIGTLSAGLNRYDRKKNIFYHYRVEDGRSLHSNYISAITEDKEDNIWLGTSYGIDILNKRNNSVRYIGHADDDSNSLSNNNVITMLFDSHQRLWAGTREGLNLYDQKSNTFTVFRKEDGLPDNTILTLVEDNNGALWVGTPNGLSRVRLQEKNGRFFIAVDNYDESNGLQGREFNEKAVYKLRSGELIFGGSDGFSLFNPANFQEHKSAPKIVLTDLLLFNRSVKAGEQVDGHVVLNRSFAETDAITLRYDQNVFSIAFAAPGGIQSGKEKFLYRLEGFNEGWLSTDGRQRTITYTNLDPGDYLFRVKADTAPGVYNDGGLSLSITILPPFWRTWPAFLLYALAGILLLLLARRLVIQRARMRFQIDQQQREAQRIHELDMLKLKFFTNVSHEFRTPLSLIITPVERMMKETPDEGQKKHFQLIYRNAKRLLALVNQLLDFRKLEKQELRLHPQTGDMVGFIRELTFSFNDLAEKKNINYTFSASTEKQEMLFDPDKIERVMFNLLSNAFKFTSEMGTVGVAIRVEERPESGRWIAISVQDSGIGIPEKDQEKIFERFFQHEVPGNMLNQGSGIGLAISREFVRLHGGRIEVKSSVGEGTVFVVWLPVQMSLDLTSGTAVQTDIVMHAADERTEEDILNPASEKKATVLVVDDNDDIRFYIKDNLRTTYRVDEAVDGKEGWKKVLDLLPDIIISDVMMPGMNGLELCKKVKQDARTSHIPVILLTARSAEEQQLEGLETGAIDYITKPFSFEILLSRVKGLLAHQEALRKLFQRQIEIEPSAISVTPVDENFIRQAVEAVEQHIAESEFSVEDLSKALFMSRVALYKKLLALTGKAPLDFIRSIRMKRAAQLLTKSGMSIAEVAYAIGFSNPKYFTRYFKKEFNMLPTEFRAAHTDTAVR